MLRIFLLTSLFFVSVFGCYKKPAYKEWPQKCQMCGSEWLVTPIKDPDRIIPPTVEWCFNDGSYCDIGLDLIIKKDDKEFLKHCFSCKGCRCAAFKPEEWNKIK